MQTQVPSRVVSNLDNKRLKSSLLLSVEVFKHRGLEKALVSNGNEMMNIEQLNITHCFTNLRKVQQGVLGTGKYVHEVWLTLTN